MPTIVDDNRALLVIVYETLTKALPFDEPDPSDIRIDILGNNWNKEPLKRTFGSLPNYPEIEQFFDYAFNENDEFYAKYVTAESLMQKLESLIK